MPDAASIRKLRQPRSSADVAEVTSVSTGEIDGSAATTNSVTESHPPPATASTAKYAPTPTTTTAARPIAPYFTDGDAAAVDFARGAL